MRRQFNMELDDDYVGYLHERLKRYYYITCQRNLTDHEVSDICYLGDEMLRTLDRMRLNTPKEYKDSFLDDMFRKKAIYGLYKKAKEKVKMENMKEGDEVQANVKHQEQVPGYNVEIAPEAEQESEPITDEEAGNDEQVLKKRRGADLQGFGDHFEKNQPAD